MNSKKTKAYNYWHREVVNQSYDQFSCRICCIECGIKLLGIQKFKEVLIQMLINFKPTGQLFGGNLPTYPGC